VGQRGRQGFRVDPDFRGIALLLARFGAVGGDGTHPGWLLQESGTSGIFQSVSVAGSNIFLTSTVAGNTTGYLFSITATGTQTWAPDQQRRDTTLSAERPASSRSAVPPARATSSEAAPRTARAARRRSPRTPRLLFNRWNLINASGTFTIAAPVNPPGVNQSGLLIICIHNASGGVVTLAWNAIYAGLPRRRRTATGYPRAVRLESRARPSGISSPQQPIRRLRRKRHRMTLALRRFLVQPVAAVVVDGVDVDEDIGAPQQVWTVDQFSELVDKCQAEIEQHNAAEETET
jgi:hypothetical protein